MQRVPLVLAAVAAAATFVVAPTASSAVKAAGQVDLTSTLTAPCTFTAQVNYSAKNASTLEVYVTQSYTGQPLVPVFVQIKPKSAGTVTVTLAPLAPSTSLSNFYVWAQLLDRKGKVIPGSLDFSGEATDYCTA